MKLSVAAVIAAALLAQGSAFAQDAAKPAAEAANPSDPLGLGEIMTCCNNCAISNSGSLAMAATGRWPTTSSTPNWARASTISARIVGSDLVDKQVGAPVCQGVGESGVVEDKNRTAFDAAFDQLSQPAVIAVTCRWTANSSSSSGSTSLPYIRQPQNFAPQK